MVQHACTLSLKIQFIEFLATFSCTRVATHDIFPHAGDAIIFLKNALPVKAKATFTAFCVPTKDLPTAVGHY